MSSCSVRHSSPEEAEMAEIALAITNPSTRIITDSKTAIKAHDTGKVSKEVAKILQAGKENVPNDLIKIATAHSGLTGSEIANEVTRGLTHRAPAKAYYSPIHLQLADVETAQSHFHKAEAPYQSMALEGGHEIHINKGTMALALNSYAEAYHFYDEASKLQPKNPLFTNNMAVCLL
ncbi:hypothetical protein HPB50_015861 [Hyalomma asiaticum]|uniref:Uncharacterized protein n=1 Tax=Hyalomma asiaticum TaxID=266040 RepID=A0ACB7T4V9_HYAAI|nr:hypothetical protein HPB50_015861 [Hyalomma asiaticum]